MTSSDPREREARNGSMMLRGTEVVSDSNGPFRLVMRVAGIENSIKLDTSQWTVSWASDLTPGDHDELLAEAAEQFETGENHQSDIVGRKLIAALRTEQSARQEVEETLRLKKRSNARLGEHYMQAERDRQRVIAERDALQQRIDAALRSHTEREWRPLDGTYLGGTVCDHCRTSWPCADYRILTAPTESEEPERDDSVGQTLPPEWSSDE